MCKCRNPKPHPGTPVPTRYPATTHSPPQPPARRATAPVPPAPRTFPPDNGEPPTGRRGASPFLPIRVRK